MAQHYEKSVAIPPHLRSALDGISDAGRVIAAAIAFRNATTNYHRTPGVAGTVTVEVAEDAFLDLFTMGEYLRAFYRVGS